MEKIKLVKLVTSAVVGAGTSKIVAAFIKNNTSPEKLLDKVTITSAAFVLGAVAAEHSKMYTDTKIDELATFWEEHIRSRFNR